MTKTAIGLLCMALIVVLPEVARAQSTDVGVLRAVAGEEPVPASGPIAVVAEIYNDIDTQIQGIIEQALTARGYTIRFDASLLLTFGLQKSHDVSPIPSGAIDSGMQEETAESEDEVPGVDFGDQGPVGDAPQMPNVIIEYDFWRRQSSRTSNPVQSRLHRRQQRFAAFVAGLHERCVANVRSG